MGRICGTNGARMEGDLPGPAVVVFQDLDDPPVGATFGEVMCSVYKAFGSTGLVTSGGGRDLDQVRALEYPVFTGATICSHAYCHILHIGLPVLQCLSPMYFRGALARKMGQFSARHNRLSHWIYRWNQYCNQYQRSYNRQQSALYRPLQWFFNVYTPLLQLLTKNAIQRDEFEADIYALQVMNDADLADVILHHEVAREFINSKYWPKIMSMVRKGDSAAERLPLWKPLPPRAHCFRPQQRLPPPDRRF